MNLFAKFSTVGLATLSSRILGFFREALIASLLGAGPVADAFYAAFRFPNLFRRLFAEGAFNAAFVPLFAKELEGGGEAAAKRFAEQVLSVLLLILLTVSALAMIFMPFLVGTIIASRFDPESEKFATTVLLTRIMFPYLTAMSLVAMLGGILNSLRKYFLAAAAPVLLNIMMIGGLLTARATGFDAIGTGAVLAWSVVVSGVLQLGLLAWGVARQDFRLGFAMPALTPAVKRVLKLALPAAITGGIVQINLLVGQNIASGQEGAIAVINYADRVNQLPLGVVGVAIAVVLLPELARALKSGNPGEAASLQNRSLEFGLGLALPAAVGLMMLTAPIVAIVFERGNFTRQTTEVTAAVLAIFAAGLPAAILVQIFRPGFFAREDLRTPMWAALCDAITNIVISLTLFPIYGVRGVAVGTSTALWVNAIFLGAMLWRRNLFRPSTETLRRVALIILASALIAFYLWLVSQTAGTVLLDGPVATRAVLIAGIICSAMAIYFAFVIATGAVEGARLAALLRRRPPSKPDV